MEQDHHSTNSRNDDVMLMDVNIENKEAVVSTTTTTTNTAEHDNNDDDDDDNNNVEKEDNDNDGDDNSSIESVDTVEPDCDMTNAQPFWGIVSRCERVWQERSAKSDNIGTTRRKRRKIKITEIQKKECILPKKILNCLQSQSLYPLFRLVMPDIDNARNIGMKENLIGKVYADALGLETNNISYKMLIRFTDPEVTPKECVGDLSLVVQYVMAQRIPSSTYSKITIGEMNMLLDELATLKRNNNSNNKGSYQHEWRNEHKKKKKKSTTTSIKPPSLTQLRVKWLQKVMKKYILSPVEHKWLVRILLKKMEFGLGWRSLLIWYNPYSLELWNAHNSLKNLCHKLADPNYYEERKRIEEWNNTNNQQDDNLDGDKSTTGIIARSKWKPQTQPATLGNTIAPMLSERTTFAKAMTQMEENHILYLKQVSIRPVPLALKNPAFCAEIKLDGERMVVHMMKQKKDSGGGGGGGQVQEVTMHTRNAAWYSKLYSPCLGPALRKAISKYNVNVILDGEVEAWDNRKEELVPFGYNRTAALLRRSYLRKHGLLEPIDMNLHNNADESMKVIDDADENRFQKKNNKKSSSSTNNDDNNGIDDENTTGKECWLKYSIFDILYVGGPDTNKLLLDCGLEQQQHHLVGGENKADDGLSLVQLSLLERKQVLYQLLQEQRNEVEICRTVVIRPNGDCVDGATYFSTINPLMECGYRMAQLDSTLATICGTSLSSSDTNHVVDDETTLEEVDRKRRRGRTNADISQLRSQALDMFYSEVVEQYRYEGLVLKDLASPYIFGRESKKLNYWRKFKPDFEKNAKVVDIDVVILGAYFATGNRHSGEISHFLCGVVDSKDPSTFMTICNVNGKSVTYDKLNSITRKTGFQRATHDDDLQLGHWFVQEEHDDPLPNFISSRSQQRETEDWDGWKFSKSKNYPDLWIHPEDSVVLTIYGQELVLSPDYSVGLALRFARISKIRIDEVDGDEKDAYDADSDESLWEMYMDNMQKRNQSKLAEQGGRADARMDSMGDNNDGTGGNEIPNYRFLTPEEYARKPTKRKRRNAPSTPSKVPKVALKESSALKGITVVVLEGKYSLDATSLDAQEAEQQGWVNEARMVTHCSDVQEFVLKHDGKINVVLDTTEKEGDTSNGANTLVVGGSERDAKVITHMTSINRARSQNIVQPKTKRDKETYRMAQRVGIIKWTFLFSIVHRWLAEQASSIAATTEKEKDALDGQDEDGFEIWGRDSRPSILDTHPEMLQPQKHQYLALSHIQDKVGDAAFDPSNKKELTLIDLQRGLEDVQERSQVQAIGGEQLRGDKPWQYVGRHTVVEDQRWILSGPSSSLWPRRFAQNVDGSQGNVVVLYPDIFDVGEFGTLIEQEVLDECMLSTKKSPSAEERWKQVRGESLNNGCRDDDRIVSCLPLARAIGAVVTPHFHDGVTHVLCNLKEEGDESSSSMVYDRSTIREHLFRDPRRWEYLSSRIQSLGGSNMEDESSICFVSPTWVRSQWARHHEVLQE